MFFSMDQFSFFGMRGNLKNVNDLINEEVEKKFQEEKRKKDAELEFDDLKNRLGKAEGDIKETTKLAREILEEWKKDSKESSELFAKVLLENKKLKEQLSNSPVVPISHEDKKEALGSGDKIEKNEKPDGSNEL